MGEEYKALGKSQGYKKGLHWSQADTWESMTTCPYVRRKQALGKFQGYNKGLRWSPADTWELLESQNTMVVSRIIVINYYPILLEYFHRLAVNRKN